VPTSLGAPQTAERGRQLAADQYDFPDFQFVNPDTSGFIVRMGNFWLFLI
jgi:hypothetical protein